MSDTISFTTWLHRQLKRNSVVGDLARDAKNDLAFAANSGNLADLLDYLRSMNACDGALGAAKTGWKSYLKYKAKVAQTEP